MSLKTLRSWPLLILAFVLLGGFLRFYNLNSTVQFLGDQGRDALIVYRLLIMHDPVFIGPVTSVGNMYLGPLYYYFMLPFYALSYPSPMGPVYAVALIGTLTILAMYYLGREMVGETAAKWAAFFTAFSHVLIEFSRFSWNPNPAPLVSIFMIWSTFRAVTKNPKYWILVSLFFSILIQLHYLTLLALASVVLVWLGVMFQTIRKKNSIKEIMVPSLLGIILFLLSLTPLVLFDLKHEFVNANAFYEIVFGKEQQLSGSAGEGGTNIRIFERTRQIATETLFDVHHEVNTVLLAALAISLVWYCARYRSNRHRAAIKILLVWVAMGILGITLYSSSVYAHYLAYLYPAITLLLGAAMAFWWQKIYLKPLVVLVAAWFLFINARYYYYEPLGWRVNDIEDFTLKLMSVIPENEPYTLVSMNEYHDVYAMNYRYYLNVYGVKPLETEQANEAKALVIINESNLPVREIMDSPIYEIVIFPDKTNVQAFKFDTGPQILILKRK